MTQPIRTIAAYYETGGGAAISPNLAHELCEEAIGYLAPHVGPIAVNWQALHIPEEPLDVLSPHLDALEEANKHIAFFTRGTVEYCSEPVQGLAIPIGEGGWRRSRLIVQAPRIKFGRHTWLKALTLHEMGHSFTSADHCADVACIMHEDLYVLDAKPKMTGEPFCDDCVDGLNQARTAILRHQGSQNSTQGG